MYLNVLWANMNVYWNASVIPPYFECVYSWIDFAWCATRYVAIYTQYVFLYLQIFSFVSISTKRAFKFWTTEIRFCTSRIPWPCGIRMVCAATLLHAQIRHIRYRLRTPLNTTVFCLTFGRTIFHLFDFNFFVIACYLIITSYLPPHAI